MFIYMGCSIEMPIKDGPIFTSRTYLRYIKNNAPPLRECYSLTPEGFILVLVCYDSNGDWIPDTVIEFSDNSQIKKVHVRKFASSLANRCFPRNKMKLKLSKRLHSYSHSLFIEPPNLHPINKSRLASSEYQKAKNTVIKFKPIKDLKEEGQPPETFPGIYYSGSDNCSTPPTPRCDSQP